MLWFFDGGFLLRKSMGENLQLLLHISGQLIIVSDFWNVRPKSWPPGNSGSFQSDQLIQNPRREKTNTTFS
jgi:hypothetical protein